MWFDRPAVLATRCGDIGLFMAAAMLTDYTFAHGQGVWVDKLLPGQFLC